jgi:septal ring-binding cell division protein DamX
MAKSQLLLIVACSLLLAACSSSKALRSPTPEGKTPWFCEMNVEGSSWDCVQDEARVRSPNPARLPSRAPEPEPAAPTAFITGSAGASDQPTPVTAAAESSAEATAVVITTGDGPEDDVTPAEIDATEVVSESHEAGVETVALIVPTQNGNEAEEASVAIITASTEAATPTQTADMLAVPPEYFTVQLSAMPSQILADKFINEHPSIEPVTVTLADDNELYHVVLLGIYESYQLARTAVENRPASLADIEPWIRPMSSVQAAMRDADQLAGTRD